MGSDPGVPLEEVCPIPGMPMPKDGYVIPTDAPGFGMEIKDEWVVPWDHTVAMNGLGRKGGIHMNVGTLTLSKSYNSRHKFIQHEYQGQEI